MGYRLASDIVRGWEELEVYLTIITGVFTTSSSALHTKIDVPFPLSTSGYRITHNSYEAARFQCVLAREKFEILLACIACLTTNVKAVVNTVSTVHPERGSPAAYGQYYRQRRRRSYKEDSSRRDHPPHSS